MAALLPVADAIARIVAGIAPADAETVPLDDAHGRTLAAPLAALRTQPPFAASSMDGYAVRAADTANAPARLRRAGTIHAGASPVARLMPGEAARIFTGAPVPEGADAVLIQENATADGDFVRADTAVRQGANIRPAGLDFRTGDVLLSAGRRLAMRELALAAAMGHAALPVRRLPRVAILSTGDELVRPGATTGPAEIVAASAPGVAAWVASAGGAPRDHGIVRDEPAQLDAALARALADRPDILVTLGGASVGEHDLVAAALAARGMDLDFWKIAMRPGKPLMFGRLGATRILGLPGNPVSSLVCAILFLTPLLDAFLGRPPADPTEAAVLAVDVAANDGRQDYVRATLRRSDALPAVTPLPVQDSSMLAALAGADCLLVRPPNAPAAKAGAPCRIIRLP